MRSAFTSSEDRKLFTPFTSSLPNGWQLRRAGQQSNGLFTFRGSALMPYHLPSTFESAARANWRSVPHSMMPLSFARRSCSDRMTRFLPPSSGSFTSFRPMFGHGLMRLQPVYVDDVAVAIDRVVCRAETSATIFEFGGPHVYSYVQFLRTVGHQAGLAPLLIPIPFAVWHALARVSEMLPRPPLTRNQVELLQIDTVSSPEMPGFVELGISPHSVEAILKTILPGFG
jgi:hypothetical protein